MPSSQMLPMLFPVTTFLKTGDFIAVSLLILYSYDESGVDNPGNAGKPERSEVFEAL
jgi:hypothetical protein